MNIAKGKINIIYVFIFLFVLIFGVTNIYAGNTSNKGDITLKEKYSGKKLDRIKSSIKTGKNYRFLIESRDSLDDITSYFKAGDKKAKIKKVGSTNYMVRLPLNSTFLKDELSSIDSGVLPSKIGNYNVIAPEIVESLNTSYLSGELLDNLWGITKIGAETFQEELSIKDIIKVGVLDTGIDYNNTDLDNNYNLSLSYDFINEDTNAIDDNGHGTQVSGIIGSEVNGAGRFGVNSNSDLVSLKVLDVNGIGTTYDILEAINYAISNNIKVLNMSFGGLGDPTISSVCEAITTAKNAGIFTVVSAGNNNTDISTSIPAGCSDSITVGAINSDNTKASFSNYGTGVNLYAPGVNIYTTSLNNTYETLNGTSFSAPFVAGLISKELAYSGTISYNDVITNVTNNYNLITNDNLVIDTTNIIDQDAVTPTGIIYHAYERFTDLLYISSSSGSVYYADRSNEQYVYKLTIDTTKILVPEAYITNHPKYIFSEKKNFIPEYFNSGEYITVDEYKSIEGIVSENSVDLSLFTSDAVTPISIGKYDINHSFKDISGQKIADINGYIVFEEGSYVYYKNSSDNYKLYRLAKDGSDTTGGIKISDVQYFNYRFVEGDYIYYQNYHDQYKLYRINKDGTDVNTYGTKITGSMYSWYMFHDLNYIYYQNTNDNYKLYKIAKDGSDLTYTGTKVLDVMYPWVMFTTGDYMYYSNGSDFGKIYKANKDGSDILTGGVKILDVEHPMYMLNDDTHMYYANHFDEYRIYRANKDGSDVLTGGNKVIDIPYSWVFFEEGNYIYYPNYQDLGRIYRANKDGSEASTGGIIIVDSTSSSYMFHEGEYMYYQDYSDKGNIYRTKLDGSEAFTGGLKINDITSYYRSHDLDYIYYLHYNNGYKFFKVKKDGTDENLYLDGGVYTSSQITLDSGLEFIKINVDSIVPTTTDYKFYLSNDGSNFIEIEKYKLSGTTNLDLLDLFGINFLPKIYFKIELIGNPDNTTLTPVINSVELFVGDPVTRIIDTVQITGGYSCTRPYYNSKVQLKNEAGTILYTNTHYNYTYSPSGCGRSWFVGSRYIGNSCSLTDVTYDDNNYYINYHCDAYYGITGGIATSYRGYRHEVPYSGTFTVSRSKFALCDYAPELCASFSYNNLQENNALPNGFSNIYSKFGILANSKFGDVVPKNEKKTLTPASQEGATGDPVNLRSGEFVYDNIVMQHNSKGIPFNFEVNYGNQGYYNGPIGYNFDYNYNRYLVEDGDGNINYHNGKLGVFQFVKTDIGFENNDTINGSLSLVDGKYEIKLNNTETLRFNDILKLESITDNFGNAMSFEYNTDSQLTKIIDTLGREYIVTHYDHYRIKDITDFNGDKVEFIYFEANELEGSEYDLKAIRTTTGTSSRELNFTYTKADNFEESHNIVKLIDSENNTYVENTYANDRVSSQKFGDDIIYYTYTTDVDNRVLQNSVIDREGNNFVYSYDANGNTTKKVVKRASGDLEYNYEYNENGYLSKEILPLGNGFTFKYDINNNLIEKRQKADVNALDNESDIVTNYTYDLTFNKPTQIVNPNGAIINFELDLNGNVVRKEVLGVSDIDLINQTIVETYEYNTSGELINKTDANSNTTSFEYLSGSLVKSIRGISPNTIETNYSYDDKGNIISITDGEGNITNLSYNDFNLLKSLTTPEGITSEYTYNKLNKKVNESIILGDLSTVTSSYTYDILDNPTNITKDIDSLRQKVTVTSYDNNNNITEITDGNNATVQFTYNEEDYITEKRVLVGTDIITTSYIYDNNNRLVKQINPNLSEINFEYDLYDRVTKQTLQNGVYTTFSYDKTGNILETSTYSPINTLLQKESNTFDKLGRNTSNTKYDLENNTSITNKTYYDAVGNIVKIVDANAGTINYSYDEFNRLSQVVDKLGNTITNTYNKNDKLLSRIVTGTDTTSITTSYTYDSDNRLISETNSLNEAISYAYNKLNQVTSKTDKDGTITTYKYDYVGNLLEETTETKTTKYEYDLSGNLVKLTDANNNVTLYEYDSLNRLVKQTYPDGNILTQTYDISGNLITRTDPNGTVITNNYDELNRLTSRDILTATGVLGATSETYTYDYLGRVISGADNLNNTVSFDYDSLNRLNFETNSNTQVSYTYDNNSNITSINNTNYSYDISNRLLSVKNGTNSVADYTYNSLTQTSQTLGNGVTTNYTYDELLRIASLANYNYTYNTDGNITSDGIDYYSYDDLGRLTGVNYDEVNIPEYNGDKIERFFYDNVGNRTSQENYTLKDIATETCTDETVVEDVTLPNGKTKTVERKVQVCETAITQVEKQKNTLVYDSNSLNQYTKLQNLNKNDEVKKEFTYIYDNNGNLTKDDINQYFYDYKNRLVKVIQNEVLVVDDLGNIIETIPEETIVEFTYDILGRRIEKKTTDKTINYIYAGQNAIKEIVTDNATNIVIETRENIYSNNLDDILSTIITDEINNITEQYFYEKNHLGSITKITDITGSIVEQYEYDVFGVAYASINNVEAVTEAQGKKTLNIKKVEGSEADNGNSDELTIDNIRYKRYNGIGKIGNTRLYTGREYDAELKLYYNRARYYSPDLGRFISRDPIDIADDVNLYAYVGNNGVMFVDRSGLSKEFIAAHDATDLLLKYMKMGREEESLIKLVFDTAFSDSKYNIKYNEEFKKIAFTPDNDKESCDVFSGGAGHCLVYVDGNKVELSQLGNFLVGYNFNYAGFTLNDKNGSFYNDIYAAGLTKEKDNAGYYDIGNLLKFDYKKEVVKLALKDEAEDRPWYTAGYNYALFEKIGISTDNLFNLLPN